ncbi:Membrane-spanning 4-domains subfamily A member 13, partial [Heterocephalus glaber]
MLGIFNVLMWYFLLALYMGQIKGVFRKCEPLTYRTGCTLWGVFFFFFIISGACIIKATKNPTRSMMMSSLGLDILCIITGLTAIVLTVELSNFFFFFWYQGLNLTKLGREVPRVLLIVYHLDVSIALMHAIFTCGSLSQQHGSVSMPATEEAES